jgi:hypothetical protein
MPQTLNYGDFTVDFQVNMLPTKQNTKPSTTNTLVVAGIFRTFFESPTMVSILERHFRLYGHVHSWAPLPSFGRIMVVYYDDHDAERARQDFDSTAVRHTHDWPESIRSMKVYRADRTEIERDPSEHFLQPPALEKNFLISPPGSPPIGWEQVREDPPNATPLAEDLIHALRKLEVDAQFRNTKVEGQRGVELLLAPEDSADGISVYVEDCDIEEEDISIDIEDTGEGWAYGEFSPYRMPPPKFVPTALPPPLMS